MLHAIRLKSNDRFGLKEKAKLAGLIVPFTKWSIITIFIPIFRQSVRRSAGISRR